MTERNNVASKTTLISVDPQLLIFCLLKELSGNINL